MGGSRPRRPRRGRRSCCSAATPHGYPSSPPPSPGLVVDQVRVVVPDAGGAFGADRPRRCEHGVCGSCTVLIDGEPVRSCLTSAVAVRGAVRTAEDLTTGDRLDPLQQAFSDEHALQCGFCTPGFLMLLRGALDADPTVVDDPERLDALLASTLCRCTCDAGIRRAAIRAAGRHNTC